MQKVLARIKSWLPSFPAGQLAVKDTNKDELVKESILHKYEK